MRSLAPDIFRQRLLLEGYYSGDMTADRVNGWHIRRGSLQLSFPHDR